MTMHQEVHRTQVFLFSSIFVDTCEAYMLPQSHREWVGESCCEMLTWHFAWCWHMPATVCAAHPDINCEVYAHQVTVSSLWRQQVVNGWCSSLRSFSCVHHLSLDHMPNLKMVMTTGTPTFGLSRSEEQMKPWIRWPVSSNTKIKDR